MKRVAVIIGHDKTSPGAYSPYLHTSEYMYNSEVASYLGGIADIYKRPLGGGYTTQMRKLAEMLNPKNYDLVVELHFNSFSDSSANGCEAIVYPGNDFSYMVGYDFCQKLSSQYQTNNRGVKEHGKGDRGFVFLSLMEAPAIIVEPFFGSNEEAEKFENEAKYAELIKDWLKCI
ncbi:MAG TPA: N-acetylmuramoyl-L-alanine amidase [Flavobacteriaceae bacterium]|nr:N-acetylmuramoyl-L-alanine amidase [Flavobacteriaceae bacterium]